MEIESNAIQSLILISESENLLHGYDRQKSVSIPLQGIEVLKGKVVSIDAAVLLHNPPPPQNYRFHEGKSSTALDQLKIFFQTCFVDRPRFLSAPRFKRRREEMRRREGTRHWRWSFISSLGIDLIQKGILYSIIWFCKRASADMFHDKNRQFTPFLLCYAQIVQVFFFWDIAS